MNIVEDWNDWDWEGRKSRGIEEKRRRWEQNIE
jgi:hypothetical protein